MKPETESAGAVPSALPSAHAALMASLLEAVVGARAEFLTLKDGESGRYRQVSAAMASFLQRSQDSVVGLADADLFDPAIAAALRAADQTALGQATPLVSEHRFEWRGARREFTVTRLASPASAGGPRLLACLWSDRSVESQREVQLRNALDQLEQQQRANAVLRRELADQALRDQASGLYTRPHFEDQLRREVDLSTREHREFALVFIEIDSPGERVALLGEVARARILEAMGRLLRGGTRAMDTSCRFDDNRFAVLLSGVGLATAHSRMEGLRRQCATQIVLLDGQELGFTVSMGVASFPHTAHTLESLIEACADALAVAQRRGGNHVTLASIKLGPG